MAVRRKIYRHRAYRRSHISRAPFAPLGSGAHSAPAWVGWLPANFIACSARLRLAAGCGQPPAACVQIYFVYKNGCPLCRNQQFKNLFGAALPSLSRMTLEKPRSKILPKEKQKIKYIKRTILV